jgi:hypothetical protein
LVSCQHIKNKTVKKITLVLLVSIFFWPAVSFAAFNQNLSYGMSGPGVLALQNFLTVKGYYKGPITGNFFGQTDSAVIYFQEQNGIEPASGFFGPLTRGVANNLFFASSTSTTPSNSAVPSVSSMATTTPAVTPSTSSQAQAAQSTLPPLTTSEMAGVTYMCSNPMISSICTSTFWNGYGTNAIFRSDVDSLAQTYLQQQAAAAQQQQANNAYLQALNIANYYANLNQQNSQALQSQLQLQQLQNTIQQNNSLLQQELLKQQQQPTVTPLPTHCGIDAGIYSCNVPGL